MFKDIGAEEEFLFSYSILYMGSLEIFFDIGHGEIKINLLILMQNPCKKMDPQTKCGIFLSSELDLHSPELNSPTNAVINWYFKPNRVPISPI